jgi:transposase
MVFEVLSSVSLEVRKSDEIAPSCEPPDAQTTLVNDQHIRLTGNKSKRSYPKTLRRVTIYDELGARELVFISNRLDLPALTIAAIYKQRWQIELFFKWLKQNLCVKHFFGNSENAVKSQIWIAVCVYLMVLIAHKRLNTKLSLRNFMHLIETHVFEKISLQALVDSATVNHKTTEMSAQENLF